MKIVFFGTPKFAADILKALIQHNHEVAAVITRPDRPKGRSGKPIPSAVKIAAQSYNPPLQVYQPEIVSALDFAPTLQHLDADLFVVVAFGEIIKQHLLDMPKLGCINVHASLLPKYRGAAPIQRCIINGEVETGVTIMHMVKKMDAGDIIETVSVPIGPEMTFGDLESELCLKGTELLLKVLNDFGKGIVKRVPQDHSQATLSPKIELEDCHIRWSDSAQSIHNLIRGVNPHPSAWCFVEIRGISKRLKVIRSQIVSELTGEPGSILPSSSKELIIGCGENALKLLEIQLEGKKSMQIEEFLHGFSKENMNFL